MGWKRKKHFSNKKVIYDCVIYLSPPYEDETGKLRSLIEESPLYDAFGQIIVEATENYNDLNLILFDISEKGLYFRKEEDVKMYFRAIAAVTSRFYEPIIFMVTAGDGALNSDLSLAEETVGVTGADVAIFNLDDPIGIYQKSSHFLTYAVGSSSFKYQIQNILEHGNRGPLLGVEDVIGEELV